jgi:hypothetical protein
MNCSYSLTNKLTRPSFFNIINKNNLLSRCAK